VWRWIVATLALLFGCRGDLAVPAAVGPSSGDKDSECYACNAQARCARKECDASAPDARASWVAGTNASDGATLDESMVRVPESD
jgi:hypothetical protein